MRSMVVTITITFSDENGGELSMVDPGRRFLGGGGGWGRVGGGGGGER